MMNRSMVVCFDSGLSAGIIFVGSLRTHEGRGGCRPHAYAQETVGSIRNTAFALDSTKETRCWKLMRVRGPHPVAN